MRGALLTLALLAGTTIAHAQAQSVPAPPAPPAQLREITLEAMARDLSSDNANKRGFAARELKRRATFARRTVRRARPGSLHADEGRILLADLRRAVVPAAIRCVTSEHRIRTLCVDTLGAIGDDRALAPLRAARDAAEGRLQKKIDKALARIEEAT